MAPSIDNYPDVFNERGASYHRAMIEQPLARANEFRLALEKARLQQGMRVCDVPSGGGYLTDFIDKDIQLIGIEYSRLFASFGERSPRAQSILASIPQLSFQDASCDRVISIAGLHHFDADQKSGFFSEACRILSKEGLLLVADVDIGSPVAGFLDGFVGKHNVTGHDGQYLDESTPMMLRRAGFDLCDDRVEHYPWEFSGADRMAEYCRLLFGLEGIDPIEIRRGIGEYLGYRESKTGCRMNWQLRYVLAKKTR